MKISNLTKQPEAHLSQTGVFTGQGKYIWEQHLITILFKLTSTEFLAFLHEEYEVGEETTFRVRFQEETKTLTVLFRSDDGFDLFTFIGQTGSMTHARLSFEQVNDLQDLL